MSNIKLQRRRFISTFGVGACVLFVSPWAFQTAARAATGWKSLHGTDSVPPSEKIEDTLKRLYGDRPIEYNDAKIKMTVPNVAENGAVVPSDAELRVPLDEGVYVKRIMWIIDNNKRPQTVVFNFTPETGAGYSAAYLRMGQTSWVRAVFELSNGALLGAKKEVKVVAGGCGG